jgi:hypothetical protein
LMITDISDHQRARCGTITMELLADDASTPLDLPGFPSITSADTLTTRSA